MPIKQKFNLASIQGIDLHLNLKRNTETFGNNSCACGSDFDSIIDDPLNTNENSKTHFDDFFFGKCKWVNGNLLARLVSPAKWQYECCEKIDSWYVTVAIWHFFSRNLYGKFS